MAYDDDRTVDDFFPGKYWKAADFADGPRTFVMCDMKNETMGIKKESKPCLCFEGEDKRLVLNITNQKAIAKAYGVKLANWWGNPIELFSVDEFHSGEMIACTRARKPKFAYSTDNRLKNPCSPLKSLCRLMSRTSTTSYRSEPIRIASLATTRDAISFFKESMSDLTSFA